MARKKMEDIASGVMSDYAREKSAYSNYFDIVERFEDLYFCQPSKNIGTRSKVFDPMIYGKTQDFVALHTSDDPKGSVVGREATDSYWAEIWKAKIKYDWEQARMTTEVMPRLLKDAYLKGAGYCRVSYECDKEEREYQGYLGNGEFGTISRTFTRHDGPAVEYLDFYNVFPSSDSKDWLDCFRNGYIIVKDIVTIEQLKSNTDMGGAFKNLSAVEKEYIEDKKESLGVDDRDKMEELLGIDKVRRAKMEMISKYSLNRWISVIGNVVVRDIDNPNSDGKIPVEALYTDVYPGQLLNVSPVWFVERLQRAINKTLNMYFDNYEIYTKPFVRYSGPVDPTFVKLGFMRAVKSNPGDLEIVQPTDTLSGSIPMVQGLLKSGFQTAFAETEFSSQTNKMNAGLNLATGLRQMGSKKELRDEYHSKFVDDFIKRIVNRMMELNRQYAPDSQFIQVVGYDTMNKLKQMLQFEDGTSIQESLDSYSKQMKARYEKLGYLYKTKDKNGELKYKPTIYINETDKIASIRLDRRIYDLSYDFIPERQSTVAEDRAVDRQLTTQFFGSLQGLSGVLGSGFLTEQGFYEYARKFGFRFPESMFNFEKVKELLMQEQVTAGRAPGGEEQPEGMTNLASANPNKGLPQPNLGGLTINEQEQLGQPIIPAA